MSKGRAAAPSTLTVTSPMPSLSILKLSAVLSDPVNGATFPNSIPGAVVSYTLRVTNSGPGTVDNNTLDVTDTTLAVAGYRYSTEQYRTLNQHVSDSGALRQLRA